METRLAIQNRLLKLVARGTPLPDMLNSITRVIELLIPGMMASVLWLDDAGLLHALIRRLRAQEHGGEWLPEVALTASARSEERWRALAEGFDVHVARPVNASRLLCVVASLVSPRRA